MRIAIFGFGSIGRRHYENLLALGEEDILVYDPEPNVGTYRGAVTIVPPGDIWNWLPEAVLICTPPDKHGNLAEMSMKANAHVFCEKPLATTAEFARDLSRRNDKVLAVGYQLRWQLGGFRNRAQTHDVAWVCRQDMSGWPSRYEKDPLEEFSHEIDAACFVKGPAEAVMAQHRTGIWEITLRHARGHSEIALEYADQASRRFAIDSDGKTWDFDSEKNDRAYRDELERFLAICRGEPWDTRLCSGAEAAHVVEIIVAARKSAREFSVVQL